MTEKEIEEISEKFAQAAIIAKNRLERTESILTLSRISLRRDVAACQYQR